MAFVATCVESTARTLGKNYREIADLLGKSPKQIDNAIQRIRTKVREMSE